MTSQCGGEGRPGPSISPTGPTGGREGGRTRGVLTALAASALLTAGCSGGGGRPAAAAAVSVPPSATVRPTPSAVRSTAPPYPTDAAGCHPDVHWTTQQAVDWVTLDLYWGSGTANPEQATFAKSFEGFGPLCQPLTVQVETWRLTYRRAPQSSTGGDSGSVENFTFTMDSVQRTEVHLDGRRDQIVNPPSILADSGRGPCVGALIAVYVGGPLTAKELPTSISSGDNPLLATNSATFPTKRIVDQHLSPPDHPDTCGAQG